MAAAGCWKYSTPSLSFKDVTLLAARCLSSKFYMDLCQSAPLLSKLIDSMPPHAV